MLWSTDTTIVIVVIGVAILWTYRLITGRRSGDSGGDGFGSFFDGDGSGDGGDGGGSD
jgi:hypothetical protein